LAPWKRMEHVYTCVGTTRSSMVKPVVKTLRPPAHPLQRLQPGGCRATPQVAKDGNEGLGAVERCPVWKNIYSLSRFFRSSYFSIS
jgi:hypothetical protein